jgi:serine/threonine-protein kinase SRK2
MLDIVMEYANGGDVFKFSRRAKGLPEAAARFIFQQLILTIDFCHSLDEPLYIRDVKPSNLLLVWSACKLPILKITDFNLAKDSKCDVCPNASCFFDIHCIKHQK